LAELTGSVSHMAHSHGFTIGKITCKYIQTILHLYTSICIINVYIQTILHLYTSICIINVYIHTNIVNITYQMVHDLF